MLATVEDDIRWLKDLNADLWPEDLRKKQMSFRLEARRQLQREELDRVFRCIERHNLMTQMFSSNMFGGYGMAVFEDPVFPGTPPESILQLIEGHLPKVSRFDLINETPRPSPTKSPGAGRDDAWEYFSKYTHSEQNRKWLRAFSLDPPRRREDYDY